MWQKKHEEFFSPGKNQEGPKNKRDYKVKLTIYTGVRAVDIGYFKDTSTYHQRLTNSNVISGHYITFS